MYEVQIYYGTVYMFISNALALRIEIYLEDVSSQNILLLC